MTDPKPKRKIVSSQHLATEDGWPMSELEFGLIVAYNGFTRWIGRCMAASGNPSLGALEILVLHNISHRERGKRLGDICFMLNIEDSHTVNYAIKKLTKSGLVQGEKSGKEMIYTLTESGEALIRAYRDTREECLIDGLEMNAAALREIAANLRRLSGVYDQAARTAASL